MAQIPHADAGLVCPLHKKDVSQVCHKCPLWVQIRGKHPQSDQEIDEWRCSLAWLPFLMIENSQMQRQTGAAVESFRNEMVRANGTIIALAAGANPKILEIDKCN
jgi:hypothetical protein